jgi:two-component sensor histidine kinase
MGVRSYIPIYPPKWWQGALLALLSIAVATVFRVTLNSITASETPYAPFITAVLVCAVWGGRSSGLLAASVGGVISAVLMSGPKSIGVLNHLWSLLTFFMLCAIVVGTVEAMKAALRREAALNEQLGVVSRELHHRVKNVVSIAQSLVQQTGRNASSVKDYQQKITDRLVALARAQDLLVESEGKAILLGALISQILAPFDATERLTGPIGGVDAKITPDLAVALSLLLNELATNATKYGALSVPEGRLCLDCREDDGLIVILWKERGGPPVVAPGKFGFGTRLFSSALPRQTGKVETIFEPDGMRCLISFAKAWD